MSMVAQASSGTGPLRGFRWPFFPWLLAAYPVLAIAAANPGQVQLQHVFAAIGIAVACCTAVLAVCRLLQHSIEQAAITTLVVTVLFYAFGPVHGLAEGFWLGQSDHQIRPVTYGHVAGYVLSSLWALLIVISVLALRRVSSAKLAAPIRFLNIAACLVVGLVVVKSVALAASRSSEQATVATPSVTAGKATPDIYYIVLDGYARADVLKQYYGFDNGSFIASLEQLGFSVNNDSYANYYWTQLSLASSLNYDYLPAFLSNMNASIHDPAEAYQSIRNSAASRFLRSQGYRFVHLQSTWGATLVNPDADEQLRCSSSLFTNEYFRTIAEASWLKALQDRATADLAACHESNFANLGGLGAKPGPKFVLAHFILPHHPYLFDSTGKVLRDANLSNQFDYQARLWEDRDKYREQLMFVNGRVLEALRRIITTSSKAPLIIVQSDHGPHLNYDGLGQEHLRVRLANFAAYLLPDAPANLIPKDTAPVNQFRYVFNHYFGTDLPILPSRHYYSPFERPYALKDVTSEVRPSAHDATLSNRNQSESPPHLKGT